MAMGKETNTTLCISSSKMKSFWGEEVSSGISLPLLVMQLALIIIVTRVVSFVLKPTKQPRIVSEILAGVLLGSFALGRQDKFMTVVFPIRSRIVLETMSNVGLLYYLFIIGVEMDLTVIRTAGKRVWAIAIVGIIMPFLVGCFFYRLLGIDDIPQLSYTLFIGITLSATAFPVVARILVELKLLNTEFGSMAMSSALVTDLATWILLVLAVAFTEKRTTEMRAYWVILLFVVFVILCIYVVPKAISWIISRTPEGEAFSEFHICLVLTGVLVSGFITDVIGTHPVFGAFVFGLVIPNGAFGITLIEKLDDFVSGLLMPLFFTLTGMKLHAFNDEIREEYIVILLPLVCAVCAAKVVGTLLVSFFYKMSFRECVSLGLLQNAKGIVELIVLNIGIDMKVVDFHTYIFMLYTTVIMTGIITPMLKATYRPARSLIAYERRTILRENSDGELRVLVCIHSPRNVPPTINLLEASHPTKKSPIFVYVLHLVELTGRASAMIIIHNSQKTGQTAVNRTQAQSDQIINAFENYEQHDECVSVQPLTAMSSYSTMHKDICNLAVDKRAAFIIIPFHKQQAFDGGMEDTNREFRIMNQNVLAKAPCSVGIFIDRGLRSAQQVSHHIAVLFFCGPDDREALSYGWRMSEHPGTRLTVIRFLQGENSVQLEVKHSHDEPNKPILIEDINRDVEMQVDEDYINNFRMKTLHDNSIIYTEKVVDNGPETVDAIRSIENIPDLFIVGRGEGRRSPLTSGLDDWSECPELGPIGDWLASLDTAEKVSVLVVQQYGEFRKSD